MGLKHSFDVSYGLPEKSTANLMDYTDGTHLAKWQWDLIHDPGVVVRLFERDQDAQIIHGITWLGDYLWGIAPDSQEREVEKNLSLYKHMNDQYEDYFSRSFSSDIMLSLSSYSSWSVRKASHTDICHKIFQKLKSQNDVSLKLNDLGIYLEKYTLDNKSYRVLVYTRRDNIALSSSIRLDNLTLLRKHKEIKAGYTSDFGLIVFYDEGGKMQMLIQIQGGIPKEATVQWLNYLGLVVPEGEAEKTDKDLLSRLDKVFFHSFSRLSELWGDAETGNYIIEMYNDGEKFDTNSYQLISAEPAMPELSFKASGSGIDKVKFQLKIEYKRDNRNDEDYFPGKDDFEEVSLNDVWIVDWKDKIRGGKATLICHSAASKDTLVFYIRGTNPPEQEIKNFLLQQGYSTDVWFLTRLVRQESRYQHFNPGTKYTSDVNSAAGCPNWGSPHGWGLMQLDVLNSTCGLLHRDGKYRPSAEALWNWKENLKVGYAFLGGEKKSITRNKILVYEEDLKRWYKDNSADSVGGYNNQIEGRVTFTHASSTNFNGINWGVLSQGFYSFMDAMWIKSYNGNSRGFYYELVVPDDEELKPYWQLNRLNSNNHNYVEAVGNQNE